MKKKFAVAILSLLICLSGVAYGKQAGVRIVVNGKEIPTQAQKIEGKNYAPVREVAEALGAKVEWDGKTNTILVSGGSGDELIPEVIKSVSPSVVGIIGTVNEDLIYDGGKYTDAIAHGTGVVIKPDGEILTNAHVVVDMEKIVVVLADGSGYEAKVKCMDEDSDLAVIKIEKTGLIPARFGKQEDIITGKTVIAIGTPASFSLRNSASIGIISGINRGLDSEYRLIQTDAAINPGNSGGPLVNLKGEVIGINSSKFVSVGIEGLGFAIPVNTVQYVLSHFEAYGKVKRPQLDVTFEEDWAARAGLPSKGGLTITDVKEDGTGEKQGLKVDDTLLVVNGTNVNTLVEFNEEMKKYLPGSKATIKIRRNGVILDLIITLGE